MCRSGQRLSPPTHFLDHPDFIAVRVRKKYNAKLRRELANIRWRDRKRSARQIHTWTQAHPGSEGTQTVAVRTLAECPLGQSWRDWDAIVPPFFRVIPDADWLTCEAARQLRPLRHLGLIRVEWLRTTWPTDPERKMRSRLLHAGIDVDGRAVHLDWVTNSNQQGGPGRALIEFRVFVDRQLAGRGGTWACSLGTAGIDQPLVAQIGPALAITVDQIDPGMPIVELWTVDGEKPQACNDVAPTG